MRNKLIKFILLLMISYLPIVVNAQQSISTMTDNSEVDTYYSNDLIDSASNGEYYLNSYDVNIKVNIDNSFDVNEKIGVYFNVRKHGIFRKIPTKNNVIRLDGTNYQSKSKVSNIKVNKNYSTYLDSGYKVIQIGDEDILLTGKQEYDIKYKYSLLNDSSKDFDELYFNIIGDEWDTSIGNVTFSITMPKEFDSSKIGFSSGQKGSTISSKVVYTVNENIIKGKYNGVLKAGEALTIRLELKEGYFEVDKSINSLMIFALVLPILFAIVSYTLWSRYGKDDIVVETIEFNPPKGFNSLEVGFLYKGNANYKDVTSLLIYLANKGYIKINEIDKKGLISKSKDFSIVKLKDYDGENENEAKFLKGLFTKNKISLFNKNNKTEEYTEVTSKELQNNFYITMNEIISNVNKRKNRHTIFEKTASSKIIYLILMLIVTYCLISLPPLIKYADSELVFLGLLIPNCLFTIMFVILSIETPIAYVNGRTKKPDLILKIFGLIILLIISIIAFIFLIYPSLTINYIYLWIYIIGILCAMVETICVVHLPKRTPYGNEMLGKIRGFKKFLEVSEKEKLEAMVHENPTYFYDILPYAYVLDVSDAWIKKFETIAVEPPDWYTGTSTFNMVTFQSFIDTTMAQASSAMSSSPSSGGGSSAGGVGGGGGGSW